MHCSLHGLKTLFSHRSLLCLGTVLSFYSIHLLVWKERIADEEEKHQFTASRNAATSFLRNRYWILRHGKSIPNERGLIVSSLENGTRSEFELVPDGATQVELAANLFLSELKENSIPLESVRICYSPFARTSHTAKVVTSVLNNAFEGSQCKVIEDLRERYFGPSYELMSHDKYAEIWALDEKDPFLPPEGGESVNDVACRLARAIVVMESEYQGHGDPLQILQTILKAAAETDVSESTQLESRLQETRTSSILSKHRKFALLTGELLAIV